MIHSCRTRWIAWRGIMLNFAAFAGQLGEVLSDGGAPRPGIDQHIPEYQQHSIKALGKVPPQDGGPRPAGPLF